MGPKLVEHLLYEPEGNGILWIKFNRPERLNALGGAAEENGTVAKVGEYMRAAEASAQAPTWAPVPPMTPLARTSPATEARMKAPRPRASTSFTVSPSFT